MPGMEANRLPGACWITATDWAWPTLCEAANAVVATLAYLLPCGPHL